MINAASGLAGDVRHALRLIIRSPGFSSIAIATLAIGIGINAAVFTLTSAFLFRGFPLVAKNDRIAYIGSEDSFCCVSYPDFEDWRDQAESFEGLQVVHGFPATLSDARGFPEIRDVTEVSAGTFELVGQAPLVGRDFAPSDASPGAAAVAILSHGFWESRYASDPAIIGQTLRLDGSPTTVIGVMPQGFSFPQKQALWVPLVPTAEVMRRDRRDLWFAFGRLREGVTFATARAEIATIGRRLADEYPLTNREAVPEVLTFNEFFVGADESTLYASMWGAVAFVLLIACANLANLMLARAIGRSREISVRIALGAGRRRIVRQLLTESVLLSILGGLVGWWLARWVVQAYMIAARGPGWSPWRVLDYTMDYRIVIYLTVVSVGTGLLFGLAPAGKFSKLDVNAALKDSGRSATSGGRAKHLSDLLVVGQVTLAVVLLAGAGVLLRSFLNVSTTSPGVEVDNVLTAYLHLPEAEYPPGPTRSAFYDELAVSTQALPGVESVAFADILPTLGSVRLRFELEGSAPVEETSLPRVAAIVVAPKYFQTLGASLLSGRAFDATDRAAGIPTVIVNERFAARHWPGEDALGKRLRLYDQADLSWFNVVGVVSNIVQNDTTRQSFDPVVYLPHAQRPRADMWVVARTRLPPERLRADFRRVLEALDPDVPIRFGPYSFAERLAQVYWNKALHALLFLVFAAIALSLATVGLYAIVAHAV